MISYNCTLLLSSYSWKFKYGTSSIHLWKKTTPKSSVLTYCFSSHSTSPSEKFIDNKKRQKQKKKRQVKSKLRRSNFQLSKRRKNLQPASNTLPSHDSPPLLHHSGVDIVISTVLSISIIHVPSRVYVNWWMVLLVLLIFISHLSFHFYQHSNIFWFENEMNRN